MTFYGIGTIRTRLENPNDSTKFHQISISSELNIDEFEKISQAIRTIEQFLFDSQLFMIAELNSAEFIELVNNYLLNLSNKSSTIFYQRTLQLNLNRVFINFLSSTRSYLDYMERLLKKRYGTNSPLFIGFKEKCKTEFESNFSYRFLYNLRNYAQHKGFPINHITFSKQLTEDNPPKILAQLNVSIDRDKILLDYKWGKLTSEIQSLPLLIDVIPHVLSFLNSLQKIHSDIIKKLITTLQDSAILIIEKCNFYNCGDGEPALFLVDGNIKEIHELHPIPLHYDLAKKIVVGDFSKIVPNT